MQFELWPQVIVSAAALAGVLIPVALAWVVIFKTTQVLSLATGQVAILGAYFFYTLNTEIGLSWWAALVVAAVGSAAVGAVIYLLSISPLDGRPHWIPVIATMGAAFIIDSAIHLIWNSDTRQIPPPTGGNAIRFWGTAVLDSRSIYAMAIGIGLLVVTLAFFRLSTLGTKMRAAAELPVLAAQTGIRVRWMLALGWALSSSLAAVGGTAFAMTSVLEPTAVSVGLLALTPVLLGGLDSIGGVFIGSLITALCANFAVLYLGASSINMVAGVLLLGVLLVRPYGLFGSRSILRV